MAEARVQHNALLSGFMRMPKDIEQNYTDVVTQVYPLKARMKRLAAFCSEYLNVAVDPRVKDAPPRFRPAAPWVLMQVVKYGKMSRQTTPEAGWFSQHELAFGIPIESYRIDAHGNEVPGDWALVYPFIYVDNPLSIESARQVYGWPKRRIVIDQISPNFEPNSPSCLISISLPKGHDLRVGLAADPDYLENYEKFLEIYQQRLSLSGRAGIEDAFMSIPRAVAGSFSFAFGALETLGVSGSAYMSGDMQSLNSLLQRLFGYMSAFMPSLYRGSAARARAQATQRSGGGIGSVDIITLKQFRDAADTKKACYQAIVRSNMPIDRIVDGGLLFDPLSGDSTGGIQINLLRKDVQPIVEALGIEPSGKTQFGSEPADVLRPVIPFWSKLDLSYGAIDSRNWRTSETGWSSGKAPGPRAEQKIKYCELGSGAKEELAGPFDFEDVNIRVFALEADHLTLQTLINSYLNNTADYQFTVPNKDRRSFVCVMAINFSKMKPKSGGEPGRDYGDRMFRFVVPVTMSDRNHKRGVPVLIPLYTFVSEGWNFLTENEVYGRMTLQSNLASPQNTWMVHPDCETAAGKSAETGLLTVQTLFVPELNQAQPVQTLTVLQIDSLGSPWAKRESPGNSEIADYLSEIGLAHYYKEQLYFVAMKEVLDADDTTQTAYKSLVGVPTEFRSSDPNVPDRGNLSPVRLKIYEYPGLPLVKPLGLKNGNPTKQGGCDLYVFDPAFSFYIAGNITDHPAQNLATQIGDSAWTRNLDVDPFAVYKKQG